MPFPNIIRHLKECFCCLFNAHCFTYFDYSCISCPTVGLKTITQGRDGNNLPSMDLSIQFWQNTSRHLYILAITSAEFFEQSMFFPGNTQADCGKHQH